MAPIFACRPPPWVLNNYAISDFCIHNTQLNLILPKEFYDCYRYLKRKVEKMRCQSKTTCTRVTKSDMEMYKRKIRENFGMRIAGKKSDWHNSRFQTAGRFWLNSTAPLEMRPIANTEKKGGASK